MSSDSDSDEGFQVRVSLKLASSVNDRSLEVPSEPIAVPADIGRKGLSAVVNHLLGRSTGKDESESEEEGDESSTKLNFEFVVAGTKNRLLRKGVEREARQYGISLEEAISITYFPATSAPDLSENKEQLPDWVSCLSFNQSILSSGCYDGSLHLYRLEKTGLKEVESATVSTGPVKCLDSMAKDEKLWIASASIDHTLSLHTYDEENGLQAYGQCIQEASSCAMSCLEFSSAQSRLLASGDGNGRISLFDVTKADEISEAPKKRKTSGGKRSFVEVAAVGTIGSAHSQVVTGVSWGNHSPDNDSHLISGSWDHSIKLWDVEKQNCLLTLNGSRVVSCLDTSYHSEGVVATGHPDCTIRLWDVRTNNSKQSSAISDNTFRPSHKAWVSCVKWSKNNAYNILSTSHDGTVKLWDIRSSNPLHTVKAFGKEEKGLGLAYEAGSDRTGKQQVFVGGTDCVIKHLSF